MVWFEIGLTRASLGIADCHRDKRLEQRQAKPL